MLLILILIACAGAYFGIVQYSNKLKDEARSFALEVAAEEGVQNDFIFVWKHYALILDRNDHSALLCDARGRTYDFLLQNEGSYQIDVGNNGAALMITTKNFNGEANYLFKGKPTEIANLERKIKAVCHWS